MSERRDFLTNQPILALITVSTSSSHTTHACRDMSCVTIDSFFVGTDVTTTSPCTDLSDGLVSCQGESTRQWYELTPLHFPPLSFHVNYFCLNVSAQTLADVQNCLYSGRLSGSLWVWREREAAPLEHLQKFITLPLMNLAANSQGAAKKCEISVGNTSGKKTQHTGQPFKFWLYFDIYL